MRKKIEKLMEAIRAIVDGTSGSWHEKRKQFVNALPLEDKAMFNEFLAWFPEELD